MRFIEGIIKNFNSELQSTEMNGGLKHKMSEVKNKINGFSSTLYTPEHKMMI